MAKRRYCSHCNAAFLSNIDKCPRDGADLERREINPLLGRVFGRRFRLVERLGAGGMGEVYRAEHETIGKSFAVKVLLGEVAADNNMVARFHREAKALSMLSHRNVVSVTDFGETDEGLLYLVTEFVDGKTLSDEIRNSSFSVERTIHIIRQIARALSHAHRRGLVHRDLKPDNIILVQEDDEPDVVKVLDFGIARVAEVEEETETLNRLTTQGNVMGTPSYMAPEQAMGTPVDHRADLYSLGIVLYELLTGRVPFRGKSAIELLSKHLREAPPALQRLDITGEFKAVTLRLLEKKPEDRFEDAESFLRDLESLSDAAALITPASGTHKSPRVDGDKRQPTANTVTLPEQIVGDAPTAAQQTLQPYEDSPTPLSVPLSEIVQTPPPAVLEASPAAKRHNAIIMLAASLGVAVAALAFVFFGKNGLQGEGEGEVQGAAPALVAALVEEEDADAPATGVPDIVAAVVPEVAVVADAGVPVVTGKVDPKKDRPTSPSNRPALTQQSLQAKVERVGQQIGELAKTADKSKIETLRRRWLDLAMSLPDLADTPAARRGFAARLRKLQAAISKAGRTK